MRSQVPLLRVANVGRSIEWYHSTLGFVGDPFPAAPPHEFAILRHGQAEIMLRRGSKTACGNASIRTGSTPVWW